MRLEKSVLVSTNSWIARKPTLREKYRPLKPLARNALQVGMNVANHLPQVIQIQWLLFVPWIGEISTDEGLCLPNLQYFLTSDLVGLVGLVV